MREHLEPLSVEAVNSSVEEPVRIVRKKTILPPAGPAKMARSAGTTTRSIRMVKRRGKGVKFAGTGGI